MRCFDRGRRGNTKTEDGRAFAAEIVRCRGRRCFAPWCAATETHAKLVSNFLVEEEAMVFDDGSLGVVYSEVKRASWRF